MQERKLLLLKTLGLSADSISGVRNGTLLLSDALRQRINEVIGNPNDISQSAIVCQNILRDGASYETLDPDGYLDHINELKSRGGLFADTYTPPAGSGSEASCRRDADHSGYDASGSSYGSSSGGYDSNGSGFGTAGSDYGSNGNGHGTAGSGYDSNGNSYGSADSDYGPNASSSAVCGSIYSRPLVRYAARLFDMTVIMFVMDLLFRIILETDPLTNTKVSAAWMYSIYVVMFAVEPLLIHLWGTTPGKLIFGIRLRNIKGEKLTLKEAYLRSFRLLRFGYGFVIPFYNIFRMALSCSACKKGALLPWDVGIAVSHKERIEPVRVIGMILLFLALTFADTELNLLCEMPKNSLPLTEEEFYGNCSHIVKYDSITFSEIPEYELEFENGELSSVTFTVSSADEEYIYEYYYEMYVAYMAFVGASDGIKTDLFGSNTVTTYFKNCLLDFDFEYAGFHITNKVEYTGYARNIISNYLYQSADAGEHTFRQTFTITRTGSSEQ